MKSGYRILWTDHALRELAETFEYLENNWTEKEIKKLAHEIDNKLELISFNPELFQKSQLKEDVRRVVVTKQNSLYYRSNKGAIEVLSFFSSRKDPTKLEF